MSAEKRKVWVVGHKNPDTDSICAAISYAYLKNQTENDKTYVENAHAEGIWAGICGELGADTSLTREFLSMGVDELSVSPGQILPIRKIIVESSVQED